MLVSGIAGLEAEPWSTSTPLPLPVSASLPVGLPTNLLSMNNFSTRSARFFKSKAESLTGSERSKKSSRDESSELSEPSCLRFEPTELVSLCDESVACSEGTLEWASCSIIIADSWGFNSTCCCLGCPFNNDGLWNRCLLMVTGWLNSCASHRGWFEKAMILETRVNQGAVERVGRRGCNLLYLNKTSEVNELLNAQCIDQYI